MARLFSSGFELDTGNTGVEWESVNNSPAVNTTTPRSGSYSFNVTSLSSATRKAMLKSFLSAGANGPYYGRVYLNIATLPSAENRIIAFQNGATFAGVGELVITLDNGGLLRLYDSVGQVGSASSALSTGTWYRIEFLFDRTAAGGSQVVSAQIDGTVFASASNRTLGNNVQSLMIGGNLNAEAQTTGSWFFDDVAVNDNTGSFQNTYAGSGKIIHLRANAQGDVNTFATAVGGTAGTNNNYTRLNEVTPNDATNYNEATANGQEDLVKCTASGIGANDTVNVVAVGIRLRNPTADATTAIKVEIEKAPSGTVAQSAAIIPNSTTWATNSESVPRAYPIIEYQDPDGGTWTQATLDTMQIGYKITAFGTNSIDATTVWALVDYTPNLTLTPSVSDSITTTENVNVNTVYNVSVSDSITTSENVQVIVVDMPNVFDAIGVYDKRQNLFLNPSFEVGTSGWDLDSDYARTNTDSFSGSWSVKQISTTGFANFNITNDGVGLAVIPNVTYTLSFYYKMTINSGLGTIYQINTGSPFGSTITSAGLTAQASWTRVTVTFNPGSNNKIWLRFFNNNGSVTAFYDAFQLELGSAATSYFDGSTAGAVWTGTSNLSASETSATVVTLLVIAMPSVSDSITTTESVTMLIPLLFITVNDSITVSENVNVQIVSYISVSDQIFTWDSYLNALSFDGSTTFVNIGKPTPLTTAVNNLCMEGWIRPNSVAAGVHRIFANTRTNSNNGFGFGMLAAGLRFTTFAVKDYDSADITLVANTTYHVAVNLDSSNNVTFYVNGVKFTQVTGTTPATANSDDNFYIGASTPTSSSALQEVFSGLIAEFSIYTNRVFTDQEVTNLYNGVPISIANLVARYVIAEGSGSTIADNSGNGNTGTITAAIFTPQTQFPRYGSLVLNDLPAISDSITTTESVTMLVYEFPSVFDTVTVSESVSLSVVSGGITLSVFDSITVYEADGTALSFDGSTGLVKKATVVMTATNNYTVMAWFKRVGGGVIASNGIDDGVSNFNGYSLIISGSTLNATFNGISSLTGPTASAGVWHHGALVRNGGTTRIYLDGVDGGVSSAQAPATPGSFTTAGSDVGTTGTNTSGKNFNGTIDKVIMFSRALSATEILNYYNGKGVLDTTSMTLDWEFNDASGTTTADSSGNGNTGTIAGTTAWVSTQDAPYSTISIIVVDMPSVSDSITTTESVTLVIPILFISVSDSISVSESVVDAETSYIVVFDATTLTESVTMRVFALPSVFDSITTTENITMLVYEFPIVFDAITTTENITMLLRALPVVFDTITTTESVTLQITSASVVFDTVTVSENVQMLVRVSVSVFDTVTVSEAVSLQFSVFINVFDTVTVSEGIIESEVNFISVFDTITVSDSPSASLVLSVFVFDSTSLTEDIKITTIVPFIAAQEDLMLGWKFAGYLIQLDED